MQAIQLSLREKTHTHTNDKPFNFSSPVKSSKSCYNQLKSMKCFVSGSSDE